METSKKKFKDMNRDEKVLALIREYYPEIEDGEAVLNICVYSAGMTINVSTKVHW